MSDDLVKRVARAWASIDGKPYGNKEAEAGGYTEGYNADAEELLRRSGIASHIEQVRAEAHAAAIEAAKEKVRKHAVLKVPTTSDFMGDWVIDDLDALHTDASREYLAAREERMPDKLPVKLVDNPRSVCDGMYIAAARGTEYVRDDLYQALTAERDALAAEVERLRGELTFKDAMLDAYAEAAAPLAKGVLKKRLAERRAALEEGKDG